MEFQSVRRYSGRQGGFTIVETLVVVALLILLFGLVVPASNSMMLSLSLTRAGQEIGDQISLARRLATTQKKHMEVRFVKGESGVDGYTAFQLWESDAVGGTMKPAGKLTAIPSAVKLSETLSPLLANAVESAKGTAEFRPMGNKSYAAIRIRPNGRLVSDRTYSESYILLCRRNWDDEAKPDNYYAIQINPLTGRVNAIRP